MVTFYVPPEMGLQVIDAVAARGPGEVWFNPGSESDELIARARARGLEPITACSIVAIGMSPYGCDSCPPELKFRLHDTLSAGTEVPAPHPAQRLRPHRLPPTAYRPPPRPPRPSGSPRPGVLKK